MKTTFPLIAILFVCCSYLPAAQSVRVGVSEGVPGILLDGKPVRARFFFGSPGSKPIPIEAKAQRVSFDFTPLESEPGGATMHLRFAPKPDTILLDDISVEEIGTNRKVLGTSDFEKGISDFEKDWRIWPPAEKNTAGKINVIDKSGVDDSKALELRVSEPADKIWPDLHVYHLANLSLDCGKSYRISFWIKSEEGNELRLAFYRPGTSFTFLGGGGEDFFKSQIQYAVNSGARFVSFPIGMPWPAGGESVNEIEWKSIDETCRAVLSANPDALLVPRIPMDPPQSWIKANPTEIITWKGNPSNEARTVAAVSSLKYRKEAAARLDALIRHLEEKFGPHIAGYHPCGQNTGEWFYEDSWALGFNGYSESDLTAWRRWLSVRYKDDAGLRAAWGQNEISLQTAEIPSPAQRKDNKIGVFRDVAISRSQQTLLDFAEFQQDMMADTILEFAKITRTASDSKRLVIFFYGYVFEFEALPSFPGTSGHYALRKVLESPDIDILCSPISYFDRKAGGSGPAMTAAESVALAGKLWLFEDDTRTYLTPKSQFTFPGGVDGCDTFEATRNVLLRNTAQCGMRHFGTWWMDLGASGWFDDPNLWTEMKQLEAVDAFFLDNPIPFRPEVAAFIDEKSPISLSFGGNTIANPAFYLAREPLGRMGTPYGQYLLDDFLDGKLEAKMNVFLSAWRLTENERKILKVRTIGKVNLWCYAPGFLDAQSGGNLESMRELTGFEMKRLENVQAWAEPTPLGKSLGLENGFGLKQTISPLFAVADAKPEEILAVYPDGSAAIVMRKEKSEGGSETVSIFCGVPGLDPAFLRLAARSGDVHLFAETDCNVYANGPFLVLHGAEDGELLINFGKNGKITEFPDEKPQGDGPRIKVKLQRGETKVLRISASEPRPQEAQKQSP